MNAHIFDLDVMIRIDSGVWIVSKTKPNSPLIRISQSEFNLIKKGIYKKYNTALKLSGTNYWFPENLLNQIKIKCKSFRVDMNDLAFSMQEFLNPEVIDNLNSDILIQNFQHLKNSNDDIYVICSKNSEKNYNKILEKLQKNLFDLGIKIKKYYFISETFYNRDTDYITHKKVRLLIQHLIGLKTDGDKFTENEIEKYDSVYFYDDDLKSIQLSKDINNMFRFILSNTDDVMKSRIKDELNNTDHLLFVNLVTHNGVWPLNTTEVKLSLDNLIKTFESFIKRF
jgi:hypothetical protein